MCSSTADTGAAYSGSMVNLRAVSPIAHWDDVDRHRSAKGEMDAVWQRLGRAAGTVGVGVNRVRVAPGKLPTPPHSHGASEELYYVLGGSGLAWQDDAVPKFARATASSTAPTSTSTPSSRARTGSTTSSMATNYPTEFGWLPRSGAVRLGYPWVAGRVDDPWDIEAAGSAARLRRARRRPANIVNVDEVERERWKRAVTAPLATAERSVQAGLHWERLEPAARGAPPHCHSEEEEVFVILDGDGAARALAVAARGKQRRRARGHPRARGPRDRATAGDAVAHSFLAGENGITMLIYGTRKPNDMCYYPRSNKISWRGLGVIGRIEALDYDDGEPENYATAGSARSRRAGPARRARRAAAAAGCRARHRRRRSPSRRRRTARRSVRPRRPAAATPHVARVELERRRLRPPARARCRARRAIGSIAAAASSRLPARRCARSYASYTAANSSLRSAACRPSASRATPPRSAAADARAARTNSTGTSSSPSSRSSTNSRTSSGSSDRSTRTPAFGRKPAQPDRRAAQPERVARPGRALAEPERDAQRVELVGSREHRTGRDSRQRAAGAVRQILLVDRLHDVLAVAGEPRVGRADVAFELAELAHELGRLIGLRELRRLDRRRRRRRARRRASPGARPCRRRCPPPVKKVIDFVRSASPSIPIATSRSNVNSASSSRPREHELVAGAHDIGVAAVGDEREAVAAEREVALVRLHRRDDHALGQLQEALVERALRARRPSRRGRRPRRACRAGRSTARARRARPRSARTERHGPARRRRRAALEVALRRRRSRPARDASRGARRRCPPLGTPSSGDLDGRVVELRAEPANRPREPEPGAPRHRLRELEPAHDRREALGEHLLDRAPRHLEPEEAVAHRQLVDRRRRSASRNRPRPGRAGSRAGPSPTRPRSARGSCAGNASRRGPMKSSVGFDTEVLERERRAAAAPPRCTPPRAAPRRRSQTAAGACSSCCCSR